MPPRADEAASFVASPNREGGTAATEGMDSGEKRLVELGYKQELNRKVSFWGTFGLSFSILSVLVGPNTLYGVGFANGGPVAVIWGWAGVSVMTTMVCLSMCEIASAYPTAGGLYFWADHLIPESQRHWKPLASWITGWCNLIGQITAAASVFFSTAQLLLTLITMGTGGANGGGYIPTPGVLVAVALGLYTMSGIVNTFSIQVQSSLNIFAVGLNVVVALFVIVAIPSMATATQPPAFVFTKFINGSNGVSSPAYVYLVGLLMAQYTLSGYDGAFHVAEETRGADWNTPVSLILALIITEILGFIYLIAVTFSIRDYTDLFSLDTVTGGAFPVAQIFWDVFESRFNHGGGSIIVLSCVATAIWLCGHSILTSNARMVYAFSRDGAIPGSVLWHRVASNKVPVFAVWGSLLLGMAFIVPYIGSVVAYNAVSSIATIALYLAYGIPIFLRTFVTGKHFVPGPFHLGKWSFINGFISILWILFITAIFVMPNTYPVTSTNLNYAGIALGAWLSLVMIYWAVSAQFWFTGPRSNMTVEEKKEFYNLA